MGDEFDDVEAMLEAPFRKDAGGEGNGYSPERDRKRRSKHRSHRHSRHSRSKSSSRSPHRRQRRSGSRERRRRRSRSGDRRRSRSRDRHRRHRRSRSKDRGQFNTSPPPRKSPPGRKFKVDGPPPPPFRRHHSPEPELPSEDRDRRTIMCMQLAALVGPKELQEFFQKVGQVKEVKMIADKNSRRSKGIAYVEFHDESTVKSALELSGTKLFGVPIIVQVTMAEKNRLAANAQNLMKNEHPCTLYVGSLRYDIQEDMLKRIFEPFGRVLKMEIHRDEQGKSKGYGFVQYEESDAASRAKENLDGFELLGRPIKVNEVTHEHRDPGSANAMEMLDSENFAVGVGMTPQGRYHLMTKLAQTAGLTPAVPAQLLPVLNMGLPQMSGGVVVPTPCVLLSNMFNIMTDKEHGWEEDIKDDVIEEFMNFGDVLHVFVDPVSPDGTVYVKAANAQVASSAITALDGRFFAGKKIKAERIPELNYHMKFPEALTAAVPLKPSS